MASPRSISLQVNRNAFFGLVLEGDWVIVLMNMIDIVRAKVMRDRIFAFAIAASIIWHLFWLFAIKVVVAPQPKGVVRFSSASFLGPLLGRGALEIRIEPSQRTFLEKRYLDELEKVFPIKEDGGLEIGKSRLYESDFFNGNDVIYQALMRNATKTPKLEPEFGAD